MSADYVMFYVPLCFHSYLIDGAESSSESDMDEDNKSDEEMNRKVQCGVFKEERQGGKQIFLILMCS